MTQPGDVDEDPRPEKPRKTGFGPLDSDNWKEYQRDMRAWRARHPDAEDD